MLKTEGVVIFIHHFSYTTFLPGGSVPKEYSVYFYSDAMEYWATSLSLSSLAVLTKGRGFKFVRE